jgi:leucyl-tRNA synthetase
VQVGRTEKMSKSKKNVVDPDTLVTKYGADTVRLFCLFASPPEKDLEWSEQGVEGAARFLNRVWRFVEDYAGLSQGAPQIDSAAVLPEELRALRRKIHGTIKRVTEDIENRFHFNTAISAVMELLNSLFQQEERLGQTDPLTRGVLREALGSLVVLLSPIVPHICEELWETLGNSGSISRISWPVYDPAALEESEILMVVQVNGKLRGRINVNPRATEEEIKQEVLQNSRIQEALKGQAVKKFILIPQKLINLVV